MTSYKFEISQEKLDELKLQNPNMGKNSHVGNLAVKIVELFFLAKYPGAEFSLGTKGADLEVLIDGNRDRYEIKGTVDDDISWSKLMVSSQDCYNCLLQGMTLIRVTSIGKTKVTLYFLKYGVDFTMIPEVRYAVKPIRTAKNTD